MEILDLIRIRLKRIRIFNTGSEGNLLASDQHDQAYEIAEPATWGRKTTGAEGLVKIIYLANCCSGSFVKS
jgi:hypothetical protein